MTEESTERRVCCKCFKEAPVTNGQIVGMRGRSGSIVKRFMCATCVARRSPRITPVVRPIK